MIPSVQQHFMGINRPMLQSTHFCSVLTASGQVEGRSRLGYCIKCWWYPTALGRRKWMFREAGSQGQHNTEHKTSFMVTALVLLLSPHYLVCVYCRYHPSPFSNAICKNCGQALSCTDISQSSRCFKEVRETSFMWTNLLWGEYLYEEVQPHRRLNKFASQTMLRQTAI